jgi:hypothetical protein
LNQQTNNSYSLPNPTLEKKILLHFERLARNHGDSGRAKTELTEAVYGFGNNDFYMARGKYSKKNAHSPIKAILDSLDTCEELAAEWRRKQAQQ